MRNVEVLSKLIDDVIKLQTSTLINMQAICRESIEMCVALYNVSHADAEAVRDADILALQTIGQYNTIFSCGGLASGSLKALIEKQSELEDTFAHSTSVSLKVTNEL